MPGKFGKRFSFKDALAYLEMPDSRLRRLVYQGRIAFTRTDGRQKFRMRGGKREAYVKVGRVEFYQADLDAFLESQRVPAAHPVPPVREISGSEETDREVAELARRLGAEPVH